MPFIDTPDMPGPRECLHSEHQPPEHMICRNSGYTWECPSCGMKTGFFMSNPKFAEVQHAR